MKVIGFAGFSGSGKTTLIEAVIPLLVSRGLRVSLIKHAHHDFDVDRPGKDSYRHRAAGADEVLVTSSRRWVVMHELRDAAEPSLNDHLRRLSDCDIALVEGFKRAPITKIEVHRAALNAPLIYPTDPHVVAVATDEKLSTLLPQLDINDPADIANFIQGHGDVLAIPLNKLTKAS
ncbi:MAG: molybdopterin-guanine dinucleotide biosynthesis protein B [Burkholderiales bacterium]